MFGAFYFAQSYFAESVSLVTVVSGGEVITLKSYVTDRIKLKSEIKDTIVLKSIIII